MSLVLLFCSAHLFSFEDLVALGTSLLIFLHFAFKPLLDAVWMEKVSTSWNSQNALVLFKWINTNHAVCDAKL